MARRYNDRVQAIEALCAEILRSPYMYKDLPPELQRLKTLLKDVETLVRDELPYLVAEVKQLRGQKNGQREPATAATTSTTATVSTEPAAEAVVEPIAEPVAEAVIEPVVEPVAEA